MGGCCGKQKENNFLINSNKCFYCSYENKNLTKLNKHMNNCKYNYGNKYLVDSFLL